MYPINTYPILIYMGYTDGDFECTGAGQSGVILEWYSSAPQPTEQVILDNELAWSISEAKDRVKKVGAEKVATIYPFINANSTEALSLYDLVSDLYLSIVPAAREPLSGNLLLFKQIYDAAKDAITDINLMTDVSLVQAYDAVNTPTWP